ncbi:acetylcholinesterase-like [Centruroides sculpturatus]|uniref:acetylcholinesterase-like n=1 Tax=Centruroides sculpturatus TaxID=218467 RepID=UPI000C6CD795|nr:acetylcholinesterase-like [Centruroides sculpturatus]
MSPVGLLRFQEPQPTKAWNDVYNATEKKASCMQDSSLNSGEWLNRDPKDISEDCLYINLWIPTVNEEDKPFSTMVWIHGGGFRSGSSNMDVYDGALLASIGNVIVASFNYRLGAFGYANFDHEEARGNMGMLDQVMALKWIHQNIEAFGGDKDTITICGGSVGATSVAHHLLSPLTKGLFKRAILQSGSNYHKFWAVDPEVNIRKTELISKELGCNGNELLNCMRDVNAEDIATTEKNYFEAKQSMFSFLPQKGSPYLPEDPFVAIDSGKFHEVDVLIGEVSDEGSFFLSMLKPEFIREDDPKLKKSEAKDLLSKFYETEGESLDRIEQDYLDVSEEDYHSILKNTIMAFGDGLVTCPIIHLAKKLSSGNRNIYHYTFNHTRIKSGTKKWMGVPHSEDVYFVFGMPFVNEDEYTTEELEFSKSIIDMWTSFAKTGKPSSANVDEEWKVFDQEDRNSFSLTLGNIHSVKTEVNEKCKVWMNLQKN